MHKSYKYKQDLLQQTVEDFQVANVEVCKAEDALKEAQKRLEEAQHWAEELSQRIVTLLQREHREYIIVNRVIYTVENGKLKSSLALDEGK